VKVQCSLSRQLEQSQHEDDSQNDDDTFSGVFKGSTVQCPGDVTGLRNDL